MYRNTSALSQRGSHKLLALVLFIVATLFWGCDNPVESDNTEIEEVAITFASNGGSPVQSQLVSLNTFVIKPEAPVKEGFVFAGWFADNTLTTEWEFTTTPVTASMILYAKWDEIHTGTVSFESNGGTAVPSQTVPIGTMLINPKDPTKEDLVFAGWYKEITLESLWDFAADPVSEDMTLYAKWIPEGMGFTVLFESNGGSKVQKQMVEEGGFVIEPKEPVKEEFLFGGWFIDTALTEQWNFTTDKVTKDMTFYAKWEVIQKMVVLSFESNGGTAVKSQTLVVGGSPIEPQDPTKSNATFVGWFKESSLTTLWDFSIDTVMDTMTLYAKWDEEKSDPMVLVYCVNGYEGGDSIRIPLGDAEDLVDLTIEWGDGSSEVCKKSGWLQHRYEKNGIYTVKLYGTLEHFGCSTSLYQRDLLEVRSFGDLGLISLVNAFRSANSLIHVPPLLPSTVTNLKSSFRGADQFNGDISQWNTENVTDMSCMFYDAHAFNQDIGEWNTGNVTDMSCMFYETSFSQDIGEWNTENVTRMDSMFFIAWFNQDIGQWNTGNVTNMSCMFFDASFNQDIGQWNTENVTRMDSMFFSSSFNQDISQWNTGNVTTMSHMFAETYKFNQNLTQWNTENVKSMSRMFFEARGFNGDLSQWNTENVTDMGSMFCYASDFNGDISQWKTENVTDMSFMFAMADRFNQDLSQWDVSSVKNSDRFDFDTNWEEQYKPKFKN